MCARPARHGRQVPLPRPFCFSSSCPLVPSSASNSPSTAAAAASCTTRSHIDSRPHPRQSVIKHTAHDPDDGTRRLAAHHSRDRQLCPGRRASQHNLLNLSCASSVLLQPAASAARLEQSVATKASALEWIAALGGGMLDPSRCGVGLPWPRRPYDGVWRRHHRLARFYREYKGRRAVCAVAGAGALSPVSPVCVMCTRVRVCVCVDNDAFWCARRFHL